MDYEMGEELIRSMVRGLSRLMILWLLSREVKTGYGVLKELKRMTGQPLSPGIIYPLLYELEREGYLSSRWAERGRRKVRFYSTTERGLESLRRMRERLGEPLKKALRELLRG